MFCRLLSAVALGVVSVVAAEPIQSQSRDTAGPVVLRRPDGEGLAVRYRAGENETTVSLPITVERVTQIIPRAQGRILVMGKHAGDSISVIAGKNIIAHANGYGAVVSADGRYVAFEKYYPPNAPDSVVTAVYNVLITDSGKELAVYPTVPKGRHRRMTELYWVNDSTVCFIDYDEKQAKLVAIALRGESIARIVAKALDASKFVDSSKIDAGVDAPLVFAGAEITSLPREADRLAVRLKFPQHLGLKVRRIDVELW